MRVAAIDIGTVTCRLLLADVEGGRVTPLLRDARICNLGEGVDETGVLAAPAMGRVRDCVAGYLAAVEAAGGCDRLTAVATSASRDARNADEFAALLGELGVGLSVIEGRREAALTFAGAAAGRAGERLLVCDSGGGSTELIAGIGGQEPVLARSVDIGCRRATERLLRHDPPEPDELAALEAWCGRAFAPFFSELARIGFAPQTLLAVAGTATSVVAIHEALVPYDPARVHGYHVTGRVLDDVTARLAALDLAQREHVPGLQAARAPVIVAGCTILGRVVAAAGTDGYVASEGDILQGLVLAAASCG